MKSTTLRRSNITREKVAMMEALSQYNARHQEEDFYNLKLVSTFQTFYLLHQTNPLYHISFENTKS